MSVVPHQGSLVAEPDMTPMQMLQLAVAKGVDTAQLQALMELKREWDADNARKAFTAAMNAFRAEAITVHKTKSVEHNGKFMYRHALLADVVAAAAPRLSAHGLSHRWETKQEGNAITVSCIITHELGHSISNSLTAPPDTSGSKNGIQAIGSAVTYLQRYTFLAITGLAAKDSDDDGGGGQKPPKIDERQIADLESLMQEVGVVGERRDRALRAWHVDKLDQILVRDFDAIIKQLEGKRK